MVCVYHEEGVGCFYAFCLDMVSVLLYEQLRAEDQGSYFCIWHLGRCSRIRLLEDPCLILDVKGYLTRYAVVDRDRIGIVMSLV